jgi:hypothetical protein
MGAQTKSLRVAPLISESLLDEEIKTVTLPIGVEYFRISVASGGGDLHWAWKPSELATGYHTVLAGEDSGNIVANPLSLTLEAKGGAVDCEIFVVYEGR